MTDPTRDGDRKFQDEGFRAWLQLMSVFGHGIGLDDDHSEMLAHAERKLHGSFPASPDVYRDQYSVIPAPRKPCGRGQSIREELHAVDGPAGLVKSRSTGRRSDLPDTAKLSGCTQVLSEDLNAGQDYNGVTVVNPFTVPAERM